MTKKLTTPSGTAVKLLMEAEVARQVRQHGRSSMNTEVCGVLLGSEQGSTTVVEACVAGANAAQGSAHVTFTQDTWEHIYQIKDRDYPEARIVGWYHSHPGFGVFLSDHDLFIHQNFFSSKQQVAWVYDPHTDEEGCFGWRDGKIEKLDDVAFRFNQPLGGSAVVAEEDDREIVTIAEPEKAGIDWMSVMRQALIYTALAIVGAAGTIFYLDRQTYMIPRDMRALILFGDGDPKIIPPELTVRVLQEIQREILQNQLQNTPAPQQNAPAGAAQNKDVPNGRK